ncbi:unnamed protein product [Bemisia tabaci]|uniref:Ionotropic receptor n=1 Tax=Bemisia tabaci TaxID=7038 RepID=A0A9P0A3W8_BEMTA|nr:unnamed protein product [Bemisia tabaci]
MHSMGGGKCDERMFLSSAELNGSVELSDVNFDITRGLYTNPIWNSKNHLIFMLSEFGRGTFNSTISVHPQEWVRDFDSSGKTSGNDYDVLIFCFKFFWRFFRGLKTIICHEGGCSRYDHFTENIVQYNGEGNEVFFDFSVTNMHRKELKIIVHDYHGSIVSEGIHVFQNADDSVLLFENLAPLFNCTFEYFINLGNEDGQKHNVDILVAQIFATPEEVDLSRFDFSVGVETKCMSILTPHSKLMPHFLVPFKVFTFAVWSFILVIAAVFVLQQYVFLKAQGGLFRGMYSETEIVQYSTSSSVYMIYGYFICGSPPRLLLGKLFTGKILFFVFIFSAFIISNIFLGGMTTLLTDTVQYPEIDTLKDLEDSDLFIQVANVESAATYFAQLGLSEKLRAKLSSDVEYNIMAEIQTINDSWVWKTYVNDNELALVSEEFVKNLRFFFENDAFLVDLPHSLKSETRVVTKRWPFRETFEFHVVEERLKTYPTIFSFLENSFFFPAFNKKIAQSLETGHFKSIFGRNNLTYDAYYAAPPKDDEPRPYTLNDLQLPFICLVAGLVLSFIVFSAEMTMEVFEKGVVFRQSRRVKNYLLTKIYILRYVSNDYESS